MLQQGMILLVFQGLPGKDGLLGWKGDKGEFGAIGLRGIKVKASATAGNIKWISFQPDILVTKTWKRVFCSLRQALFHSHESSPKIAN